VAQDHAFDVDNLFDEQMDVRVGVYLHRFPNSLSLSLFNLSLNYVVLFFCMRLSVSDDFGF